MKKSRFFKKFDSLFVNRLFLTDGYGKLYFHLGLFGMGYFIPTSKKEQRIRIVCRTWWLMAFPLFFCFASICEGCALMPGGVVWGLVYYLSLYGMLRGLERRNKRSIRQFYQERLAKQRRFHQKRGWIFLIIITISSLVLFLISWWRILTGQTVGRAEFFGTIFLSSIFLEHIHIMYCKFKDK